MKRRLAALCLKILWITLLSCCFALAGGVSEHENALQITETLVRPLCTWEFVVVP